MYRNKRLLVSLRMDARDESLIRYAGMVARMSETEQICFLHVAESLEIPGIVRNGNPDMLMPLNEYAINYMGEAVKNFFNGPDQIKISYNVVEGMHLTEILDMAVEKEIDLILVGKKKNGISPGGFNEKLARKAPCSVLIVPEGAQPKINKILTPLDFSENSADALDMSAAFARGSGLSEILTLNVYRVPTGYYKTGKSYEEFAEIIKKNARGNMSKLIRNTDLGGITAQPVFILDKKVGSGIEKIVKKEDVDLLVMYTRGRSAAASLVLKSVTEQLILQSDVPLIAVKKKDSNLDVIQALFAIR